MPFQHERAQYQHITGQNSWYLENRVFMSDISARTGNAATIVMSLYVCVCVCVNERVRTI